MAFVMAQRVRYWTADRPSERTWYVAGRAAGPTERWGLDGGPLPQPALVGPPPGLGAYGGAGAITIIKPLPAPEASTSTPSRPSPGRRSP